MQKNVTSVYGNCMQHNGDMNKRHENMVTNQRRLHEVVWVTLINYFLPNVLEKHASGHKSIELQVAS